MRSARDPDKLPPGMPCAQRNQIFSVPSVCLPPWPPCYSGLLALCARPGRIPTNRIRYNSNAFWQDNADGTRTMRQWVEGQTETNPDNIKLLIERHAPLRGVKE